VYKLTRTAAVANPENYYFYLECCLIEESDELSSEENHHLLPQKLYTHTERERVIDLRLPRQD